MNKGQRRTGTISHYVSGQGYCFALDDRTGQSVFVMYRDFRDRGAVPTSSTDALGTRISYLLIPGKPPSSDGVRRRQRDQAIDVEVVGHLSNLDAPLRQEVA